MPSSESSSSSNSESSAPSSPEAPKKASQFKSSPPKVPKKKPKPTAEKHQDSDSSDSSEKVSKSQSSSPEASKRVQKSPEESNTSEPLTKASKSPSSSPEAPKKVIKPPKEVPKDSHTSKPPKEVSKSPSSSPEAPKKVVKPPKEVPKESDISVPPKKGSVSPPGSPEASKTVLKTYKKVPQKLQTSWPPKQPSKSPSSSPEAPKKIVKSPTEVSKEAHSGAPRQDSQPPPSSKRPKMVLRDKPPSCQEESGKASTAPEGSTEDRPSPKDPGIALKDRPRGSFKSSLQVLLKRQEEELEKTIEYKEKLEKGELDDEEDDAEEEDAGRQGRRGSEANTAEDKRRKKSEDGGRKEAKEQQKDKPKKQKEDEDVKTKAKNEEDKAKSKDKTKPKADEDITKTKKREEDREKKTKEDQEATDSKAKRKEEDKNKNVEDKAHVTIIKIEGKEQRKGQAEEPKTEEKEDKEEMKKPRKEETVEAPPKREKKVSVREKTPTKEENQRKEEEKKETKTKKQEEEKQKKEEEEEEVKKAKRKEEMTKEKQRREEEEKKKSKKKEEVREEAPRREERPTEAKASVQQKKSKEEKTIGHLYMKRKRTFNPWKEYYFVLDDQLLTYYRSQQQYEHLSGMKGSLDLSLVEVVQPGRPGLLKTHHPICLTRRNLPSIHLAAATKQDQQRWVDVLRSAVRPHRLSACNSDQTLNTASSAAAATAADQASESKSNTLPARVKSIKRHSSSASDEEEDEEKEEKKEEEPELIQPKKVLRVPIGLPMAGVNLGQVKLKRAETKKEDAAETATTTAAAAHSTAQDIAREKSPPGELFGVVLKKTKKQEEEEEEEEEEKKAPKDTTATTASVRRPSKQPVIPLNSGKLLVVPEVKSSKTSPDTQKRQTPERKKSPSPSLPISKSVQALTKSAEEVRATQADVASHEPSSSASMTPLTSAAAGEGEVVAGKLCHAQTTEVQYSNVEVMEEVVEVLPAEREAKNDDDNKDEVQEIGQDAVEVRGEQRHKGDESLATAARPPRPLMGTENNEAAVCAGLQGGSAIQEREENLDKECREASDKEGEASAEDHQLEDDNEGTPTPPPDTPSAPQPLTPPASPASSKASADSDKSSSPPSPVSPPCKSPSPSTPSSPSSLAALSMQAVKSSPSLPQPPPVSPGTHSEESQVTVEAVKGTPQQEDTMEGKVQEGSWETRRPRADSNESTGTSSSECSEKKPGKLQSLKRKLTGGSKNKEKREEPASPKEPKKRRGSNAFSELMARKKNGGKKPSEEPQPQVSQGKTPSEPPAASQPAITVGPSHMTTASSEPPSLEASLPPGRALVGVNLEEADPTPPQKTEDRLPAPADRSVGDQSRVEDVSAPSMAPPQSDGACHDTHSLSVVPCDDQPPSIPEKTGIRAHSPNHDVPRSNRPVTNIHEMVMGVEDEEEAGQTVDGYMTEEQIEALLHAKENREKRRQSKKGAQHLLSPQDAAKGATLPATVPTPSSEELGPSRPFFNSFSSVESDESLPVATFLGIHRNSSSSGSGDSLSPETEAFMETQRRASRPTDAITVKHRVSLTSPEFTVQEEEGLSSPETVKARPSSQGGDNDKREQKNGDDPQAKVKKGAEDEGAAEADSEGEQEDFFPVVGRDVQLRQPATQHGEALSLPKAELRTSGIIGLKEYLKAQEQEDLEEVKSGISRLGHSAAVEKLKQEASREQ